MALDLRDVAAIATGELLRHLRDGQTLLYSVALPLFLYPALFLGLHQAVTIARGASERRVVRVAVRADPPDSPLAGRLAAVKKLWAVPLPVEPEPGRDLDEAARRWIGEGTVDALVFAETAPEGTTTAEVFYDEAREGSHAARERLAEALEDLRQDELRRKAAQAGAGDEFLDVLSVRTLDIARPERRVRDELARFLPLLILIMTAIGGLYPALDTTVGERERGTLETTLLAPASRRSLMLGKYLPVAALAFFSAAMNFLSMGLAACFFLFPGQLWLLSGLLAPRALAPTLAAAALLALLLAALLCVVALFARSFKEGQSYLGPVMVLVLLPGLAATIPDLRLTPVLAAVPVLNLSLVIREALLEKLDPTLGALAFASTAAFAALAIFVSSRLVERETVLLGAPAAAPEKPRRRPRPRRR